ncbi:MAG: efflux RND transporter periplasmic adaptor subunit [Leptolyngbyaceae cyanobacterium]
MAILSQSEDSPKAATVVQSTRHRKSMSSRWLLSVGVLGGLLLVGVPLLYGRLTATNAAAEPTDLAPALTVDTLTVATVDNYEVARAYTGEIAALRSSELGFSRGGELVQIMVEEGDRVTAGQALARLDTQNLMAQRQQLEAQKLEAEARLLELQRGARQEDIAAARAAVQDVENQLRLQERQRSRREYLYEEGAISREQLDEFAFGAATLEARLDQAQSNLDELLNGTRPEQVTAQQAVVQQLAASIADLDVSLDKSTLKAPFGGVVAAQVLDEGAVVGAGQTVVRLIENGAPEARIGLPEAAASRLPVGTPVTVTLSRDRYDATVKSVLPEIDPNTRTQMIVFQLEPAALATVNPGQTVRVELTETIDQPGIWLPIAAMTQDLRGLWSVYTLLPAEASDGYEVQPQAVEILHQESDRALVRGTLQTGDRIVVNGVHRLVPGQQVQPFN